MLISRGKIYKMKISFLSRNLQSAVKSLSTQLGTIRHAASICKGGG